MRLPAKVTNADQTAFAIAELAGVCRALGADTSGGPLSEAERTVLSAGIAPDEFTVVAIRKAILAGEDPLGDLLLTARSRVDRRRIGQFLTPAAVVSHMVRAALRSDTEMVIDAGCGSGRFALKAADVMPDRPVFAVDFDPLATLVTRANAHVREKANIRVIQDDFLTWQPPDAGRRAFLSNPPYVRHHDLTPSVKHWGHTAARALGYAASSLSGLHAYFLLATALKSRPGDRGSFITSAEWLDVGYGSVMRSMFANGLGLERLELLDSRHKTFGDVMTTAVVTTFERGRCGDTLALIVDSVDELVNATHAHGQAITRHSLESAVRWSDLLRPVPATADRVALGTYVRVSRGLVTGANGFFVMTADEAVERGLERWTVPAVTDAREIQGALRERGFAVGALKRLLVLPREAPDDEAVRRYLADGVLAGHDRGYIASRRHPWWHLGRLPRPVILATYMSRSGPSFVLNEHGYPILNIAHGLYPHEPMTDAQLVDLVTTLNAAAPDFIGRGRTYHGGLEKFEPREMEQLLVKPLPDIS